MEVRVGNFSGRKVLAMWSGEEFSYGHFMLADGFFDLKDVPLAAAVRFIFLPGDGYIVHHFSQADEVLLIQAFNADEAESV